VLALLVDVKDHPEDDAPRLVLTDWLAEHGDEHDVARAEYLRCACELDRLAPADPRRAEIERRSAALWSAHAEAWLGPLCAWRPEPGGRGLLQLQVEARPFAGKRGGALVGTEAYAWVDSLVLRNTGAAGLARLTATPLLGSISSLRLPECHVRAAGARTLASSPQVERLTTLDLYENWIDSDGVAALADSPHLGRLRHLELGRNTVGPYGVVRLAESPLLGRLRSLGLSFHSLGDDSARVLARAPGLAGLASLDLSQTRVGDPGAIALAGSANASSLAELNLWGTRVSQPGTLALATSAHLPRLHRLRLNAHLGDEGAEALAGCPHRTALRALYLACGGLSERGVRALLASPHFTLSELELSVNPIGDGGALALAESPRSVHFTRLWLSLCGIGDAGARALADSPYLDGLTDLLLAENPFGADTARALRRRFGRRARLTEGE
jgi:uncharacterized protein (TIGR02996 family)